MGLSLLAIEGDADLDAMIPMQGDCRSNGQWDAFVSRTENHIGNHSRFNHRRRVCAAESSKPRPVVDGPKIEKVGAAAAGLQREISKSQYRSIDHQRYEVGFPGQIEPSSTARWISNNASDPRRA